jgi:hypothetical protein
MEVDQVDLPRGEDLPDAVADGVAAGFMVFGLDGVAGRRGRDRDEGAGSLAALASDDDGAVAGLNEGVVEGGEDLLGAADGVGADGGERVADVEDR